MAFVLDGLFAAAQTQLHKAVDLHFHPVFLTEIGINRKAGSQGMQFQQILQEALCLAAVALSRVITVSNKAGV